MSETIDIDDTHERKRDLFDNRVIEILKEKLEPSLEAEKVQLVIDTAYRQNCHDTFIKSLDYCLYNEHYQVIFQILDNYATLIAQDYLSAFLVKVSDGYQSCYDYMLNTLLRDYNIQISESDMDVMLRTCIGYGEDNCFKLLLKRDVVDVNYALNYGKTYLMYAAQRNQMEIMCELLNTPGIDVHALSTERRNACHYAVSIRGFMCLTEHGCNPDLPDANGATPFTLLARSESSSASAIINYLLNTHKVNIPQNILVECSTINHQVVTLGILNRPKETRIKLDPDVLVTAINKNEIKSVSALIKAGVDPNVPCGSMKVTALHCAIHNRDILKLLLKLVPDTLDYFARDNNCDLAVTCALKANAYRNAKLLFIAEPKLLFEPPHVSQKDLSWLHFYSWEKSKYFIELGVKSCFIGKRGRQGCLCCGVDYCNTCLGALRSEVSCFLCGKYVCGNCTFQGLFVEYYNYTYDEHGEQYSLSCTYCAGKVKNGKKILLKLLKSLRIENFIDCEFNF